MMVLVTDCEGPGGAENGFSGTLRTFGAAVSLPKGFQVPCSACSGTPVGPTAAGLTVRHRQVKAGSPVRSG